jgi:hypothetical protein
MNKRQTDNMRRSVLNLEVLGIAVTKLGIKLTLINILKKKKC